MRMILRADCETWAFAARARAYHKYRPSDYQITIAYGDEQPPGPFDACFFLDAHTSREPYPGVPVCRLIASHAWLYPRQDPDDWRTRGVNKFRNSDRVGTIVHDSDVLAVYNQAQYEFFTKRHSKVVLCPYTVDRQIFEQCDRPYRERLRVGWAFQVNGGLNSFKGLADIVVPLAAKLGDVVEWCVITPDATTSLTPHQLASFYKTCDIFLCTSSGEGGPQGPFEAASTGCVVVGTDVGQLSDWSALRELELVAPVYRNATEAKETVYWMACAIEGLIDDREFLTEARHRLADSIRNNYDASVECPKQLRAIVAAMPEKVVEDGHLC